MDSLEKELSLWVSLKYGERSNHLTDDKLFGLYETCLHIAQDINDDEAKMVACHQLGAISFRHSQFTEAIKYSEESLNIAKERGYIEAESIAYGYLGNSYHSLGDYNKAAHYHLMSLNIATETGDKEAETRAYSNLGNCYFSLGHYDKAIQHQELSLNIAKQIGYKAGEGSANSNLGNCYHCLGQYHKAIHHHEVRLRIAKQIGDKVAEGRAYGNLGNCYLALEQYDKAILQYSKRLDIATQIGDKVGEARAHGALGNCYEAVRQYDKAIHHHEVNLAIAKQIGDKVGEGSSHGSMGTCYSSMRQHDKAINHIEIQLNIAKQIGNKEEEATAHNNLSVCYLFLEQYQKAELNAEESLRCYETLFENTPKKDQFKVSIRDTFVKTYRLLTEALLNQNNTDKALVVAEKGRARALADLMFSRFSSRCVEVTEPTNLDVFGMIEIVKALRSSVLYLSFDRHGINEWLIQPNGKIKFTKKESQSHNVAAVKQEVMSLISKAHNQDVVRCNTNCEDRSLSFMYPEDETGNSIEKTNSSATLKVLDSLEQLDTSCSCSSSVRAVRDDAKDMTTCASHSKIPDKRTISGGELEGPETNPLKILHQMVLAPVQEHVKGNQLVVVADEELNLVPFSALVEKDGHYVAESLQVRLVPSLSTAKMILDRPQEPGSKASALIVGDPDVSVVFPKVDRLPCARREAQMIGHLFGSEPLTGKNATKESFLQKAESASLIHIAAHGDMKRGEILFALNTGINRETAKKKDYLLQMSDIEQKRLKAKLVVLSCCNSARGQVRADGVIGIARAFLGAGARSVLVALWKINDEATLFFMRIFYQHLSRGEMASEALDQAMKAMRNSKEFNDPRFWAPFVLIGDNVLLF